MKTTTKLLFFMMALLLSFPAQAQSIINPADYDYWRELSQSNALFADMKADAILTANKTTRKSLTRDAMGANALAYILDPENKATYVKNIKLNFESVVMPLKVGNNATGSSVLSHQLIFALLALDVVGDDLDAATRKKYEDSLEEKVMQLVIGKWDPHGWAMRMFWYKYIGDQEKFAEAKAEWEIGLTEHFMPDGVSPAGSVYCIQRWTSVERTVKNTSIDLMEYMGYHEYYSNPAIIGHQEFLFGYASSPFGRGVSYGDSRHVSFGRDLREDGYIVSPTSVRGLRFSQQAYKSAMWMLSKAFDTKITDQKLKGYLNNYLIMAGTAAQNNPIGFDPSDAELAPSRLFDNYAALITREQSTNSLYLALQSLKGNEEYHTHYEVNAIGLAGYGEILLRNAGYNGPNRDVTVGGYTATFKYMHSSSESSSCVMLGGKQHKVKTGGGVTEGFTGLDLEYFRASSGDTGAIDGLHLRDVVFMQPSNGANGYYIVMDHLTTNKPNEMVNVIWHPNAAKLQPVTPKTQYLSEIKIEKGAKGPELHSKNQANLTTFLATEPTSIDIKTVVNQEEMRERKAEEQTSYVAEYMMANYAAKEGSATIMTVLFPGDKSHATGEMARVVAGEYSGATIVQGNVADVAFTSTGLTHGEYNGVSFKGEDVVYRSVKGEVVSYFVRGTKFYNGSFGFESQSPVGIYLKAVGAGMSGSVSAPAECEITLRYPKLKSVVINGQKVSAKAAGGSITIKLPAGNSSLELLTK